MSRLPACRSWFPLNSNEGYDGSFLFYPWTFLKEETTSKKTSKLLYYFLSLCKTFNELFHLPPPLRNGHTRPCFPKASAKVQPFTITAKRFTNFFPGQPRHKDTQAQPHGQETRCKTRVLQQETPNTLRENFFSEWKEVDRKETEDRGRKTAK